jgi:hypothetical protein
MGSKLLSSVELSREAAGCRIDLDAGVYSGYHEGLYGKGRAGWGMTMSTLLRDRTIDTLKLGHYSARTIRTYIDWLIRLSRYYDCSPGELDNGQVQDYLLYLTEERGLAWSTVNQASWLFFGRDRSRPMPIGSAQKIFYQIRNRAGLAEGSMHTLRHSFATHMLESGADIYELKRLLGHSAIATTSGYIHISQKHLSSVVSPLDRL